MKKGIFILLLIGLCSAGLAGALPQCTDDQADSIVNKIKTDDLFNQIIHHLKALAQEYPKIKNCADFHHSLCSLEKRYTEIYYSENCQLNARQSTRVSQAVMGQLDKEFREEDYKAVQAYHRECGRADCRQANAVLKREKPNFNWNRIFE